MYIFIIFFLLKSTLKGALRYLFNVIILLNLKINFRPKVDPKTFNLKNLKEVLKTWKKFAKNLLQSCLKV